MVKKEINFTFTNGRSRIILMTENEFEDFERKVNSDIKIWRIDGVRINIDNVVFYEELEEGY